ncbi:hypothetical protein, partial [Gemella morbillorum]
ISIIIKVGAAAIIWYYGDYIEQNSAEILKVLKNVFYQVAYQIEDYFDDTFSLLQDYLSEVNSELPQEEEAVDSAGKQDTKINHIMTPDDDRHHWSRLFKNPKWNDITPLLVKTLKEGEESIHKIDKTGITYQRVIDYSGEKITVTFRRIKKLGEELLRIGTAYVND